MASTTHLTVEGMKCDGCSTTVRARLAALPGVASVEVDLARKRVAIEADRPVPASEAAAALAGTKFVAREVTDTA
jgi:copper chaperone CopZ